MKVLGHLLWIAVLSAGAGYLLWRCGPNAALGDGVIPNRGGEEMNVLLTGDDPHYLQGDANWCDDEIGGSGETIRSVGCTLCSVAMGLEALGQRTDPKKLNAALIREKGYTERGWLIWSAVGKVSGGKVEVVVEGEPSFTALDRCLKERWYALVKFFLPGKIPHWVLVVGKKGDDYLVKDPAYSKSAVVPLSKRARAIYSVRYLRPGP